MFNWQLTAVEQMRLDASRRRRRRVTSLACSRYP